MSMPLAPNVIDRVPVSKSKPKPVARVTWLWPDGAGPEGTVDAAVVGTGRLVVLGVRLVLEAELVLELESALEVGLGIVLSRGLSSAGSFPSSRESPSAISAMRTDATVAAATTNSLRFDLGRCWVAPSPPDAVSFPG